jgi:hypothetical protein
MAIGMVTGITRQNGMTRIGVVYRDARGRCYTLRYAVKARCPFCLDTGSRIDAVAHAIGFVMKDISCDCKAGDGPRGD